MKVRPEFWMVSVVAAWLLALQPASRVEAQDVRSGVEQLAAQITKAAPEGKPLRIAVADFPDLQGVTSDLGRYIASRLTTRLAQSPKFFVVERQRLTQILTELKFGLSDLVDPSKAKQLGRMAGVEAIVVGTVADVGSQFDFDARMIDIESNRLLLGTTVTIAKDPAVDEMNKRGRQEPVTGGGTQQRAAGPIDRPEAGAMSMAGFTFAPGSCGRARTQNRIGNETFFQCTLVVVNQTNEEVEIEIHADRRSRVIDERGNQYDVRFARVGNQWTSYSLRAKLPPKLPVNVYFSIGDVSIESAKVSMVISIAGFRQGLVLRDLPVKR